MLVLTIRTDKPAAEIGLFEDDQKLAYETWPAHRQLAETIHHKIDALLGAHHKTLHDIEALIVFQGPGSFTGLRIGLSVANALASSLAIPTVGGQGDDWIAQGHAGLLEGSDDRQVLPEYGAPPHITPPKH